MKRNKALLYAISSISVIMTIIAVLSSSFAYNRVIAHDSFEYEGPITVLRENGRTVFYGSPVVLWDLKPFEKVNYLITVPDSVKNGDYLMFRKNFSKFNLYLEDELIYSYYPNAKEEGRPQYGGGAYFYIPLGENSQSKTIRLEAVEQPEDPGVNIASIYFGNGACLYFHSMTENLDTIVISMLLLVIAVIALVSGKYARDTESKKSLYSSAALFFILCLWLLNQSRGRQYIINNTVLPTMLSFFCIYFFPLVLDCYCKYNFPIKHKANDTLFSYASYLFIAAYIIIGVLSLFGLFSFNEALTEVTFAIVIFTIAFILFVLYEYFIKKEKLATLVIMLSILAFSFILEFILLVFGISLGNTLTLYAVAIAAIIAVLRGLYIFMFQTKERKRKEALVSLAFRDSLTGLRNRQDYESTVNAPFHETRHADIFVFDVNRLKSINDEEGHAKGNELLKDVALAIMEAFPLFRQKGFRTGGDEFIVISPSSLTGDADKVIFSIKESLREKYGFQVVSIGHVTTDTKKESIKDAVRRADLKMYEDKKNDEKAPF